MYRSEPFPEPQEDLDFELQQEPGDTTRLCYICSYIPCECPPYSTPMASESERIAQATLMELGQSPEDPTPSGVCPCCVCAEHADPGPSSAIGEAVRRE